MTARDWPSTGDGVWADGSTPSTGRMRRAHVRSSTYALAGLLLDYLPEGAGRDELVGLVRVVAERAIAAIP